MPLTMVYTHSGCRCRLHHFAIVERAERERESERQRDRERERERKEGKRERKQRLSVADFDVEK